jgi:hypothetical protein
MFDEASERALQCILIDEEQVRRCRQTLYVMPFDTMMSAIPLPNAFRHEDVEKIYLMLFDTEMSTKPTPNAFRHEDVDKIYLMLFDTEMSTKFIRKASSQFLSTLKPYRKSLRNDELIDVLKKVKGPKQKICGRG